MAYTVLVPAYGRDYKSLKEVKADWEADKDFMVADLHCPDYGRYANRSSFKTDIGPDGSLIYDTVNIRYAKLTKVAVLKV